MTATFVTGRGGPSHRLDSGRSVNVCFVIDRLSRAGTETQLLALIRHLDRTRVRPSLCLLNGNDAVTHQLLPPDCPTIDLRLRRLASPRAVVAAARLAGFWSRHRADVVQTYLSDSSYFGIPLARTCGIRSVIRVRNNLGYFLTPLHRRLSRLVGKLARMTLSNSEEGVRALVEKEGLPPDRVRFMPNGVDLSRFRTAPRMPDGFVRVGAVANLRPVKNIDGLVRAAALLVPRFPQIRFEVAGEGDQRQALECQIREAGLSDRFLLRGSCMDVPAFLASLDVAVLCSHSESMSNALLEYMAAGRAVVTTDVGASGRLVRHGREGRVVPAGDASALAMAIDGYVREPELARAHGLAGRIRAELEFGRTAMVGRFEEFFVSLIERHGPRERSRAAADGPRVDS